MEKKSYKVWFDQVNQQVFTIEAINEEEAIKKAIKEWNREFKNPYPSHFEEQEN